MSMTTDLNPAEYEKLIKGAAAKAARFMREREEARERRAIVKGEK